MYVTFFLDNGNSLDFLRIPILKLRISADKCWWANLRAQTIINHGEYIKGTY